ncbi:glycoside hydrolase family 127 protein [Aquimarina sp. ERC-38]|uniref:beta-L-arabinofuranosidase domain-containing protein n=1 Tax=Aquimarina sp. ERC-38 TaxID=2949996 RepID=UPI002245A041|nr:beta-L-arabinofuranosidase domain-containing protein [Aquimarina sp. ERC-38]UZO81530.1 glycoside hydrolase family 127 protein [Aquimarina sp. ERC-38]
MKFLSVKFRLLLIILCIYSCSSLYAQHIYRTDLPSNQLVAKGWVKEFLQRQESGLTGNPEESGWPFNTNMWCEEMDVKDDEFQYWRSPWWPYEHTGYYLDGALRAGYAIDSQSLLNKVDANIKHVLANVDKEGRLRAGNIGMEHEWWPMVVFMRMLFEKYDATQDPDLLNVLEKHYQATYKLEESFRVPKTSGFYVRSVLHVEHLCELYRITGNEFYLKAAERLYTGFQQQAEKVGKNEPIFQFSAKGMIQELKSTGHGVTYHEFLKLPAILYKYTGDKRYKEAIYGAVKQLEDNHELADGLASCSEPFAGKGPEKAHEMCNTVDYNWSLGYALLATGDPYFADKMEKNLYNSGFSCVTSNFKAHQYFSAPNLVMSTGMSSEYDDHHDWGFGSKGRLSYKPGHDTQCCSGNVHRMFPTFLSRTCMIEKNKNKVSVVFYLPATINIPLGDELFSFTQKTNYPFEHDITIEVYEAPVKKIALDLRIPGWTESYQISLNGKEIFKGSESTLFKTLSRKFKKGDLLTIRFKTSPQIDNRGKGIAINYGPLVFSKSIQAKTRLVTSDYAKKCSPEFPAYEMYPLHLHDWAVALSKNLTSKDIEVVRTDHIGYPWEHGNTPIKLKVAAMTVKNWDLIRWSSLAPFPEIIETKDKINLELEPMGSTLLRLTEFPKAEF